MKSIIPLSLRWSHIVIPPKTAVAIETGIKENVITTGQISIAFEEQNNISLVNRYPEVDSVGIASNDPNSSMTFTVSGNIIGDATVNYAIGLTSLTEGKTLTQDYIKIYLTKIVDNIGINTPVYRYKYL